MAANATPERTTRTSGSASRASSLGRTRTRSRLSSRRACCPSRAREARALARLDVGDHLVDLVLDLRGDLVHPVRIARVGLDLFEQRVFIVATRHPFASEHDVAAPELLHRSLLAVSGSR